MDGRVKPGHDERTGHELQPRREQHSPPPQPRQYPPSHHPVLVALRQEAQLLGDVGDALPPGCGSERVGDVGREMAALRPVGVEQALQVARHVAEGIRFERIADRAGELDADVRIFRERSRRIDRRRDVRGEPVITAR